METTEEKKVTTDSSGQQNNTQAASTAPSTTTSSTTTTTKTTAPQYKPQNTNSGYNSAMKTLQAAEYTAPDFTSDYDQTISDIYQKITTREPFKYDYSTDPLYGQYKEAYTEQGKQAMRDTMGQAAALTGGYGSSYGQAVGQQQYDAYLQRLNDVMPDLYNTAFAQYESEGQQMKDQYTMANQQRETQYNQFRDAVKDKQYADAMALQEAEARAQYGDFTGYGDIYGKDAQHQMAMAWASASEANGQVAFDNGEISGEEYNHLFGKYPRGFEEAPVANNDDIWGYGGAGWNPGYFNSQTGYIGPGNPSYTSNNILLERP